MTRGLGLSESGRPGTGRRGGKTGPRLSERSQLNGEARLPKAVDQTVSAGTILADGTLVVEASRVGEDTTFGQIIELVEEAQDKVQGSAGD